jgi:hypothetical protein
MSDSTECDSGALTPPFFVLFGDGMLWAYDATWNMALSEDASIGDLRAWDSTGRDVKLIVPEREGVGLSAREVGTSGRADLHALLADRLRKANVRNVELLSFDEMVYKASIRFVAPKPGNTRVGVFVGLLEGLLQLFGGHPR